MPLVGQGFTSVKEESLPQFTSQQTKAQGQGTEVKLGWDQLGGENPGEASLRACLVRPLVDKRLFYTQREGRGRGYFKTLLGPYFCF